MLTFDQNIALQILLLFEQEIFGRYAAVGGEQDSPTLIDQ